MSGFYSPWHLAIFFLIVLLLFGTKRLPEMGRSLGKGMREFKNSVTGNDSDDDESIQTAELNPASEAGPASSYCSSCGSALAADARFCARCGASVAAEYSGVAAGKAAPTELDS